MSAQNSKPDVVLRQGLPAGEPVRIGRAQARPAPGVAAARPADAAAEAHPQTQLQAALAAAREEGLRLGHEEGGRLGREEGLRSGYDDGFRTGHAEAQAAGCTAIEQAVADACAAMQERERQLTALAASIAAQQASWREQLEEEAVAFAYELACRVLGAALVTPEGVRAQAKQLLAAGGSQPVGFHVHPDDFVLLQAEAGATAWVADPAVALGGCVVKGTAGVLDARLETILAQCRDALLELRARRAAASGSGA